MQIGKPRYIKYVRSGAFRQSTENGGLKTYSNETVRLQSTETLKVKFLNALVEKC